MSLPFTATAPSFYSLFHACQIQCVHQHRSPALLSLTFPFFRNSSNSKTHNGLASRVLLKPLRVSISRYSYEGSGSSAYDPELRSVLELATDSELYELERILFGSSYFSPLLKSIAKRADIDHITIEEDPDEREDFISLLQSRFLYLAADARSTLRGWRPSYRNVLLGVRKKLNVPCSAKLSVEGLEVEIFLHLLQEYSSEETLKFSRYKDSSKNSNGSCNLELGLSQWKMQKLAALGIGASELRSMILKGGGMLTFEKLLELLGGRLSGKVFSEAVKYHMKKEIMKKGGQFAAINLESGAALLAARQGQEAAAAWYLGLRSFAQLLGPMMWGTLLADMVIQMLGTDYSRILRAIYAFAQVTGFESIALTKQRPISSEKLGKMEIFGLPVKETPDEVTDAAVPLRSSLMQWPFPNKTSAPQLSSFTRSQDGKPEFRFDSVTSTGFDAITSHEAFDSDYMKRSASQKSSNLEQQGGVHHSMTISSSYIAPSGQNLIGSVGRQSLVCAPRTSPMPSSSPLVGTMDSRNVSKNSGSTQLTIFYNGSVCVYDNISPEKAQSIMLLAGNGPPPAVTPIVSPPASRLHITAPQPSMFDGLVASQPYCSNPVPISSMSVSHPGGCSGSSNHDTTCAKPGVVFGAVPQFRRKSLARFLEKRKDRLTSGSPYSVDRPKKEFSNAGAQSERLSVNSSGSCTVPAAN